MMWIYELSWLWKTLGIALSAAVISITCTLLLCKGIRKNPSKTAITVIGVAAFLLALLVIEIIAQRPALI